MVFKESKEFPKRPDLIIRWGRPEFKEILFFELVSNSLLKYFIYLYKTLISNQSLKIIN